jgi:pimeloyl-ACP methyl ester carboxylesterase
MRAEALWFGRGEARCFGVVHAPARPSTRGVIFCPALGFEGVMADRAYQLLGKDLNQRDYWTLRFDYDGEGDSAGSPWDENRVDAWIASIDGAVATLAARGVDDIQLVGMRMGASLAYEYATSRGSIAGVVLWVPCSSGAAHVREMRALSRLSAIARPPQRVVADWFPDDALEVVGFEFSGETLRDLAAIDMVTHEGKYSVPAALVIDRAGFPPEDAVVEALVQRGVAVEREQMEDYNDFMTDDLVTSAMPFDTMRRIVGWLDRAQARRAPGELPQDAVATGSLVVADNAVVEETVWIDDRFFAIVDRPASPVSARDRAIVLCSCGLLNRAGSGRLHVTLGRLWASLGFTVVRVDLGGAGESLTGDPLADYPLAPDRIHELTEITNRVRRVMGFKHIALGGLCSGAFNAYHAVIRGLDVDELMMVNPGVFYLDDGEELFESEEGAIHSAHTLARAAMNPRKWGLLIRDRDARRHGVARTRQLFERNAIAGYRLLAAASARNAARAVGLPVKAPTALVADLEAIIGRGINVLMVFAAGESSAVYLRTVGGKSCERLAAGEGLDVVDIDGGDHVFSPIGARAKLVDALTGYLERMDAVSPQAREFRS